MDPRFGVPLIVLFGTATASASGFENWQNWGGSSVTANLTIVEGAADYDNDGDLDIAVYKPSSGKLWVGRNTGSTFQFCSSGLTCISNNTEAWSTISSGSCGQPLRLHSGDVAGDGRPDIVAYNQCTGTITGYANNGSAFSVSSTQITVSPASGWEVLVDSWFSSTAKKDLLVAYGADVYVANNTNGVFGAWTQWSGPDPSTCQFRAGEFSGDTLVDAIAICTAVEKAFVGERTTSGLVWRTFTRWSTINYPVTGRFTGTNRADVGILYVSGSVLNFDVQRNAGFDIASNTNRFMDAGTWTSLSPADYPSGPTQGWRVQAGDFVSRQVAGVDDLFAYHTSSGTFWIAPNHGMPPEGYVWPRSVEPGERIDFYISGSLDNTLTNNVEVQPLVFASSGTPSLASPLASRKVTPAHQFVNGSGAAWRNGPNWSSSFYLEPVWPSGVYVATLYGVQVQGVSQSFQIVFVVKPSPTNRKPNLQIFGTNTWNAYNKWGGESKYTGAGTTTFLRPEPENTIPIATPTSPSGPQSHLAYADATLLGVVDRIVKGIDSSSGVDVITDSDFHSMSQSDINAYSRIILGPHPEYWSTVMYDKLKSYLTAGKDLLYLGGNGIFEEMSFASGNTKMISYGGAEYTPSEASQKRGAYFFRWRNVGTASYRPERALLGIATHACYASGLAYPYEVAQVPTDTDALALWNEVYKGTSLSHYSLIGSYGYWGRSAGGHEVDRIGLESSYPCGLPPHPTHTFEPSGSTPSNLLKLAGKISWSPGGADMTVYRSSSTGVVFSVGSVDFAQSLVIDADLRAMVENIIRYL